MLHLEIEFSHFSYRSRYNGLDFFVQPDRLEIGTGVKWNEEEGENGPQATVVRIVDKPGSRISKSTENVLEPLGWKE